MKEYLDANKAHWNDLVEPHAASKFYDVEGFKQGRSTLDRIVLEGVGDVKGKSLLHLQCHFGLDTLSFARLGAEVTGIDFSPKAIKLARSLATELGLEAQFVCSDIYDLPNQLSGERGFDIVFTSYGILSWLPDLKRWAKIIAHFLKTSGIFFIAEIHPFSLVFADDDDTDLRVHYPYFNKKVMRFDEQGSYADANAILQHPTSYEWTYTMSGVINSLISTGLRINYLKEYPECCVQMLPFMVKDKEGFWRLPDGREDIPFTFALQARKEHSPDS